MSEVLAIIPARTGSKGIPNKNFKPLAGGLSCADRALLCARHAGVPAYNVYLSTDWQYPDEPPHPEIAFKVTKRPLEIAQDDTPMIAVVKHALEQIPGPPDQIIVLLQPTQPLREPRHIISAIEALTDDWDSVVTITPIPRSHAPSFALMYSNATLGVSPWLGEWNERPTRRQDAPWPYVADGTAYVFRRETIATHAHIYGEFVRGVIIPSDETCPLDTAADWIDAERRLCERQRP